MIDGMDFDGHINGKSYRVSVEKGTGSAHGTYKVRIGEAEYRVDARSTADHSLSMILDGKQYDLMIENDGRRKVVQFPDYSCEVELGNNVENGPSGEEPDAGDGLAEISSPMPGRVIRILVEAGAEVKKGQGLMVVEAMKMENEIQSPKDGTVKDIFVNENDAVETGTPLTAVE
jgi:biotin carboxyl carrier protein